MTETSKQYTLALFSLAEDIHQIDEIYEEFHQFVGGIDDLGYKFFLNPKLAVSVKHETVENVLNNALLIRFMKTVIDNNRFHLIEEMCSSFKSLINEKNQVAELFVYSKHALTKTQKNKISKKFEKVLNKKIIMNEVVQPSIVGGIRIEYQGKVLDQTINASLDQLKSSLIG